MVPVSYSSKPLSIIDWSIIVIYLGMMIGVAMWTRRSTVNRNDYFVAGRSQGWLILSMSIFASLFSTISFTAIPGEGYEYGLLLMVQSFGYFLFIPLGIWLFLRFFFTYPSFTAYEYLQHRFNLTMRLLASAAFIILRLLYIGTILYAVSKLLQLILGWPPIFTILVIGFFCVSYAAITGIKTLIWSEFVQGTLVMIGIVAIVWKLLAEAGYDVGAILLFVNKNGHGLQRVFHADFYRIDFYDRINFWPMLLGCIIVPLFSVSCDQLYVQRLLSSKGYDEAKRAVWGNNIVGLPVTILLFFIGIGLFYFYQGCSMPLPHDISSDQIMGYFINTRLHPPLPGLIVSALLAALVSTVNGVVNSLATVVYCDWLVPMKIVSGKSSGELFLCRIISVISGFMGTGIALLLLKGGEDIKSSVLEISAIWSGLFGILLVAFLLGVAAPKVSGKAMVIGFIAGCITTLVLPLVSYYLVPDEKRISFMWLQYPGMIIATIGTLFLSILFPNTNDLKNLTLFTMDKTTKDHQ